MIRLLPIHGIFRCLLYPDVLELILAPHDVALPGPVSDEVEIRNKN